MWHICSLPGLRRNYAQLKDSLVRRFGRRDLPTTARNKLHDLLQKSLNNDEFGEEVRRLVTLAYPGVDLKLQDQLAAETFLKGYKNIRVAYNVMNQKSLTLNAASELVTAQEHNFRATSGRDKEDWRGGRSRRVSFADEEAMAEDEEVLSTKLYSSSTVQAIEARLKELESLVKNSSLECRSRIQQYQQSNLAAYDKACFQCGEKGTLQKGLQIKIAKPNITFSQSISRSRTSKDCSYQQQRNEYCRTGVDEWNLG
ncbi:uncharacterized protein [Argopecten irradians]|uniref:uncharacterized protein n=1 Tax=Argopecten irradians TaxID=31199 RepID=UPI0037139020